MRALVLARGIFAATALVAVGSLLWFGLFEPQRRERRETIIWTGTEYAPRQRPAAPHEEASWAQPPPLRRDSGWGYELFTPPEIHYDPSSGRLSALSEQIHKTAVARADASFALELLKVAHRPFRLQLVGYVGGDGDYLGTFENGESGETFLARAGRQLPELGLEIVHLSVCRERANMLDGDSMPEPVAVARVRDLRSGKETVLSSSERSYTEELGGLWRSTQELSREFEAKTGDVIAIGAVHYTVEKLHRYPPAAEVRREVMGTVTTEHLVAKLPAVPSQQ